MLEHFRQVELLKPLPTDEWEVLREPDSPVEVVW